MLKNIKRLLVNDEGATLVEYGLVVALIAAVCIGLVAGLGTQIAAVFTSITGKIAAGSMMTGSFRIG